MDQEAFDIRCEWGENGVTRLAPISDVVIIVDVLSFSTCVDVTVNRGAILYPYRWKDFSSKEFAESIGAELAGSRLSNSKYSLSPVSLLQIPPGTKLILPSPNGSTLSVATGKTPTLAGCLRNCHSVAEAAMSYGKRIAVIPAGERWIEDGSLRPAVEDLLGAGAIIHHLHGSLSPEARAAAAAFLMAKHDLQRTIIQSISGQEMAAIGFEEDANIAAEYNVSDCTPVLRAGAYVRL